MSPRKAQGAGAASKAATTRKTVKKASRLVAGKRQILDAKPKSPPTGKSASGKARVSKGQPGRAAAGKIGSVQDALRDAIRPEPDDGFVGIPDAKVRKATPKKQGSGLEHQQQPPEMTAELPDGKFDNLKARRLGINRGYVASSSNKPQFEMIPPVVLANDEGATSLQMREALKVHTYLGELGDKAGLWIGKDDERPGRIVVRAGDAQARVVLDAAECAIKLRDAVGLRADMRATEDGCNLSFYDDDEQSFAYLGDWGGFASLYLGGRNRLPGRIVLRKGDYEEQIVLDAESGDIVLMNADCAEEFDVADDAPAPEPGTVLVLDDEPGRLRVSAEAYDTRVAGIVSGAGEYKPAIVLDRRGGAAAARVPVALMGKVYCRVEADSAPIVPGTLLTTSTRPGTAMAATERDRAFGAVLGKALAPLARGTDMLPVLVTLQ